MNQPAKKQHTPGDKLQDVRSQLNTAFKERKALIDGMLTALLAGEHVLALGPPGTSKSLMAREFAGAVAGGSYFELLLTKFTSQEEVLGPISFKGLKEDRYERKLDGFAASAEIVFFDEIWKASSSILNSTLTLMQERVVHNNGKPHKTPLKMVMAASNEYPQDDSLAALFDRFAIKFWVDYIADADSLAKLLEQGGIIHPDATLNEVDLAELRKQVCAVPFGNGNIQTLLKIKEAVTADGFLASDRTWIKATKMLKARAVLNGRSKVSVGDFMVLADMLWKEHKDRPNLKTIIGNAADPYGSRAEAIVDGVKAAMQEMPSFDLLKSGQKTKPEMINLLAKINGRVGTELDKIRDVETEADSDSSIIVEAREAVEAAVKQIDELMQKVTWHREQKK
jgi:MoxR-like ATPase